MSDLIDTTEMYLRTIYELEEEGITPLRARIAERLGHSGPTVSQTVARMERDGLVHVSGDRHLELSDAGRTRAVRVMRKHRLAERLLVDVIGLEWEFVHDEACRWEHVMSERVERKVVSLLAAPMESPYGNPIPGLAELGSDATGPATGPATGAAPAGPGFRDGVRNLVEALDHPDEAVPDAGAAARLVVRRLGEPLQTDVELLGRFARAGLRPGATLTARRAAGEVWLQVGDEEFAIGDGVAVHVFVARS